MQRTKKITPILLVGGIATIIFGVRLHLIHALSYPVPYFDDWGMGGIVRLMELEFLPFQGLFAAWNGHLVFWSKLINFAVFNLNQKQWDTQVMMTLNAGIWAFTGAFLASIFVFRHSDVQAKYSALLVLVLWLFPSSLMNALWGVQTHNYLMIMFSVLAIWWTLEAPLSMRWFLGVFCCFAAALTMGGGAFVSMAIFAVTLLRFLASSDSRKTVLPTLLTTGALSVLSVTILMLSSGDQNVYKAKNIGEFVSSLAKTLAFPWETFMFASVVMLLPPVLLGLSALWHRKLDDRATLFSLTLFAYSFAIAIAIAYIRGAYGGGPNERYFEFLQIYQIGSFSALLLLQKPIFSLSSSIRQLLLISWLMVFFIGGANHVERLHSDVAKRSVDKPYQQKLLSEYMVKRDIQVLRNWPLNYLPFASADGLVIFLEEMAPLEMLHYRFQVPAALELGHTLSPFKLNNIEPTASKKLVHTYQFENVIGSYSNSEDAPKQGVFKSQILSPKRNKLMIPVTGSWGVNGARLELVDEVTNERVEVINTASKARAKTDWLEVYVDSPANPYRLIASDLDDDAWIGFAPPRTIGSLTTALQPLLRSSPAVWLLGLGICLICLVRLPEGLVGHSS